MKYVRTKDGELGYMNELGDCYFKTWMCNHKSILKENFKYTDTIEELIDEYVRVHKTTNDKPMICDKELAVSSSKYPKCYDVYGSVWVDGELRKVAKMNEKGELELL